MSPKILSSQKSTVRILTSK